MITRERIESFIPGQWTLTDAEMQEIKDLALLAFDDRDSSVKMILRTGILSTPIDLGGGR